MPATWNQNFPTVVGQVGDVVTIPNIRSGYVSNPDSQSLNAGISNWGTTISNGTYDWSADTFSLTLTASGQVTAQLYADGVLVDNQQITVQIGTSSQVNAINDSVSVSQDTAITLDPLANDTGIGTGGTIDAIITNPQNGTAVRTSGNTRILYTPNTGYSGTDTIQYRAKNSSGDTDTAFISLNVGSSSSNPGPVLKAERTSSSVNGFVTGDYDGYFHSTNVFGTMLVGDYLEWDLRNPNQPIINQKMTWGTNTDGQARAFPTRALGGLFGKLYDLYGYSQVPRLIDQKASLGQRGWQDSFVNQKAPAADLNDLVALTGFPVRMDGFPNVEIHIDANIDNHLYNNVLVDMYANRSDTLPPDYNSDGDPLNDHIQPPYSKYLNLQVQMDHGIIKNANAHAWGFSGATVLGTVTIDGQLWRYGFKQETLNNNNFPFISFCGWNGSQNVVVKSFNARSLWNWVINNWSTILSQAAAAGVSYGNVTQANLRTAYCDGIHLGSEVLGPGTGRIVFNDLRVVDLGGGTGTGTGTGANPEFTNVVTSRSITVGQQEIEPNFADDHVISNSKPYEIHIANQSNVSTSYAAGSDTLTIDTSSSSPGSGSFTLQLRGQSSGGTSGEDGFLVGNGGSGTYSYPDVPYPTVAGLSTAFGQTFSGGPPNLVQEQANSSGFIFNDYMHVYGSMYYLTGDTAEWITKYGIPAIDHVLNYTDKKRADRGEIVVTSDPYWTGTPDVLRDSNHVHVGWRHPDDFDPTGQSRKVVEVLTDSQFLQGIMFFVDACSEKGNLSAATTAKFATYRARVREIIESWSETWRTNIPETSSTWGNSITVQGSYWKVNAYAGSWPAPMNSAHFWRPAAYNHTAGMLSAALLLHKWQQEADGTGYPEYLTMAQSFKDYLLGDELRTIGSSAYYRWPYSTDISGISDIDHTKIDAEFLLTCWRNGYTDITQQEMESSLNTMRDHCYMGDGVPEKVFNDLMDGSSTNSHSTFSPAIPGALNLFDQAVAAHNWPLFPNGATYLPKLAASFEWLDNYPNGFSNGNSKVWRASVDFQLALAATQVTQSGGGGSTATIYDTESVSVTINNAVIDPNSGTQFVVSNLPNITDIEPNESHLYTLFTSYLQTNQAFKVTVTNAGSSVGAWFWSEAQNLLAIYAGSTSGSFNVNLTSLDGSSIYDTRTVSITISTTDDSTGSDPRWDAEPSLISHVVTNDSKKVISSLKRWVINSSEPYDIAVINTSGVIAAYVGESDSLSIDAIGFPAGSVGTFDLELSYTDPDTGAKSILDTVGVEVEVIESTEFRPVDTTDFDIYYVVDGNLVELEQ